MSASRAERNSQDRLAEIVMACGQRRGLEGQRTGVVGALVERHLGIGLQRELFAGCGAGIERRAQISGRVRGAARSACRRSGCRTARHRSICISGGFQPSLATQKPGSNSRPWSRAWTASRI